MADSDNSISGGYSSVSGGSANTASGQYASVSGGGAYPGPEITVTADLGWAAGGTGPGTFHSP